jgi:hypothetical protein
MTLKRIRIQLERHAPAPTSGPLTQSEAFALVASMRERHTDDELREIIRSGDCDVTSLSRSQLWRLVRGEPYAAVVG